MIIAERIEIVMYMIIVVYPNKLKFRGLNNSYICAATDFISSYCCCCCCTLLFDTVVTVDVVVVVTMVIEIFTALISVSMISHAIYFVLKMCLWRSRYACLCWPSNLYKMLLF